MLTNQDTTLLLISGFKVYYHRWHVLLELHKFEDCPKLLEVLTLGADRTIDCCLPQSTAALSTCTQAGAAQQAPLDMIRDIVSSLAGCLIELSLLAH